MRIFTPDTKCDFIGCDVPNISVEKFASNVCHAIRTQFAEREHVSRLFEWVIDTQKTVTISRPFVYAAPEYGKLCSSNPHIHVAELFGEEPELLTRTVVPAVDPDVRAVFACLRVLDVEHESVFVCDCPIGFHPRAGKPYRLRRLTADQEYRRANRVDLVYGMLFHRPAAADAEIVSAVHAAADCDLAVRVE